MKSQADCLLHVAESILLQDCSLAYPALKRGFIKDLDRLALYCRTRGLTLFTLDLPNLDSLLLSALETGRLSRSGALSHRVSSRVKVPRLFSGLWLRLFDNSAHLKEDADINAIFFLRQLCCLGKKIAVECSHDRIQASVGAYHDIERELRKPSLDWDGDELVSTETDSLDFLHLGEAALSPLVEGDLFSTGHYVPDEKGNSDTKGLCILLDKVQQVADFISGSFDIFDPIWYSYQMETRCNGIGFRHGPGAVAERLGNWEKSQFPNWPAKLEGRFPFRFIGTTFSFQNDTIRPINHEVASRLIAVPKTAKGPRLIASEPTAHQFCQQGLRQFLVDQLKVVLGTSFVDFQDQHKSGAMVLQASLDRKLATVDLSDASDRLTCWTVERVFRNNISVLHALHAARTRYLRDDISKVPSFLKLKKFASQGTAVTFPIQSIVFLCVAIGVCIDGDVNRHNINRLRGQVRVFGDDIIIPKYGYERLCRVLDSLQLKVNRSKSFVNGHFRESCGVDGYKGYDVTPVKPKTLVADSPASCQAVVDTTNNLFNKGLWYASDSLRALLPVRLRRSVRIVGINDAGFSGFTSYSGSYESHLVKRWNSSLHRYEVRVFRICGSSKKRSREGWPTLLEFFSNKHNHEHARIVSTYVDTRKARFGLSWEPLSSHAQHDIGLSRYGVEAFLGRKLRQGRGSSARSSISQSPQPLSRRLRHA